MPVRVILFLVAALSLSAQGLSNRRAPSFSLPDSTLRQHDILDYRGTWLLIDFTETAPMKCKELSVKLEAVKKKYGVKVNVLSIVLAPPETQASVAKLVVETKMTTPVCSIPARWRSPTSSHSSESVVRFAPPVCDQSERNDREGLTQPPRWSGVPG
jgi:hypothetical protein